MERKIEDKYTLLEYNTILSIIFNIKIGLESFKQYKYINQKTLNNIEKHIELINLYYYNLTKKYNSKNYHITLDKEDVKKINTIFEIEYLYKELTVKIWQNELSDVFNLDENYKLLVHMCRDNDDLEYITEILKNDNIRPISTSLIISDDLKTYCDGQCSFGFVYDINYENFLGACEGDAQLEQTTDNSFHETKHSFLTVRKLDKHCINSTVHTASNNYQMTLTKTPYTLKHPFKVKNAEPYYNEIGLDKKYATPKAIIYFSEMNPNISDKIKKLSKSLNIPVIEMKQKEQAVIL